MLYMYKEAEDYRRVYRILEETTTHFVVDQPFFTHFGNKFSCWRKKKQISKKWLEQRKFVIMPQHLAKKYDAIKQYESTAVLFD